MEKRIEREKRLSSLHNLSPSSIKKLEDQMWGDSDEDTSKTESKDRKKQKNLLKKLNPKKPHQESPEKPATKKKSAIESKVDSPKTTAKKEKAASEKSVAKKTTSQEGFTYQKDSS